MKTATTTTATNAAATNAILPAGKNSNSVLPAGKTGFEMTFGKAQISGDTIGVLSANLLETMGSIDRLGYPSLLAIAVIGGLKDGLKFKSTDVCKALGSPVFEGQKINYSTPKGIGRRISRLTAYIGGFKAIASPFELLKHVTDFEVGAQIICDVLESNGYCFDTVTSTFIEDEESEITMARRAAEKAEKDAAKGEDLPAGNDEETAENLTAAASAALDNAKLASLLIDGYVATSTSEKKYSAKELKLIAAENDKLIAALIASLTA